VLRPGNGTRTSYSYDAAGQTTQIFHRRSNGTSLLQLDYRYDTAGNRQVMIEGAGTARVTWLYDNQNQLTEENRTGTNAYRNTFTYDSAGNRTLRNAGGTRTTYSYDVANQLTYALAAAGRTTYTFDAAGNQSVELTPAGARTTTTWNYENQPTVYQLSTGSRVTMSYNADNRRTQKQTAATVSTKFIWEPTTDAYFSQLNNANTNTKLYTFEPVQYGNLISQRVGGDHYVHADALGSTRALSSTGTTVSDTFLHDAWGTEVARTGATAIVPFRWVGGPGYYYDTETQLFYVRARVFQPTTARWISQDLFLFVDSFTHWQYALNSPLTRIDPTGTKTFEGLATKIGSWILGPVATHVSFISDFDSRGIDYLLAAEVYRKLTGNHLTNGRYHGFANAYSELAASANDSPHIASSADFNALVASKEFRAFSWLKLKITCCENSGNVQEVSYEKDFHNGWTPIRPAGRRGRTIKYMDGEGDVETSKPFTGMPCTQMSFYHDFRIGPAGQFMAKLYAGRGVPWVWGTINYTLCCNNDYNISFFGSNFPSHNAYIDWRYVTGRVPTFWDITEGVLHGPTHLAGGEL
jgi:RHS repeat-associated protein